MRPGFGNDVPLEIKQALDANLQLQAALRETGLPRDFQAMVLGLATFRQINPKRSSNRSRGDEPNNIP